MIRITPEIALRDRDVRERFVPSPGSESRKEARKATAVELRVDIRRAALPTEVQDRLLTLGGHRVTADGVLVVVSRARRSQRENREAARDRLVAIVRAAARPPAARIATSAPEAARPSRTTGRAHSALHRAVVGELE